MKKHSVFNNQMAIKYFVYTPKEFKQKCLYVMQDDVYDIFERYYGTDLINSVCHDKIELLWFDRKIYFADGNTDNVDYLVIDLNDDAIEDLKESQNSTEDILLWNLLIALDEHDFE